MLNIGRLSILSKLTPNIAKTDRLDWSIKICHIYVHLRE